MAELVFDGLTRWEGLTVVLDHGCIELNPNSLNVRSSHLILNRKNALCADTVESSGNLAIITRLIENSTIAGNTLHSCLIQAPILARHSHPINSVDDRMPWIDVV